MAQRVSLQARNVPGLEGMVNKLQHYPLPLAFLAGALLALGFAPFEVLPVLCISLPGLYLLLTRAPTRKQALWRGFFFGYGFFMAGTGWIANALLVDGDQFAWLYPFSLLGLSAVMALWSLPFAYAVWRLRTAMNPALFALLWTAFEWLRALGPFGFPWNLVGYMSLSVLEIAQAASVVGVFGLSWLLVALGCLPIYWFEKAPRRRAITMLCTTTLLALYGAGAARLSTPTALTETQLRVVQPNVPQAIKGSESGIVFATAALEKLTQQKPEAGKNAPDVVIWPETAYPFTLRLGGPIMVPGFSGTLLTGAVRAEGYKPHAQIWNSLVALSPSGDVLGVYDKHQLVPFGEFVPLRHVLPLQKITPGDLDFSRGEGQQTLDIAGVPPFSPLICYEGIFPQLTVNHARRPNWLLNLTNDGWYGNSPGPYQHFAMVRMRAIEQGLPMVRAANSGISAVIDPHGRILHQLGLHTQGIIDTPLPAAAPPTPFGRIF